ncbi:MAG: hypothetical protein ACRC2K_10405 [Clostridium sp.]
MKKILTFISVVLLFCGTLTGCTSSKNTDALLQYINTDMKSISDTESKLASTYENARNNNLNDYDLYLELNNKIIPLSRQLIDAAEDIKCGFDDLKDTHEIYLKTINTQDQAFTIMLVAIEEHDYEKLAKCNELLAEARRLEREYISSLENLCKKNNVVLNGK